MPRLPDSAYSKPSYSGGSIIGLHQESSGTYCEKVVLVPFGILKVFSSTLVAGTGIVISTNIQTVTGWSIINSDNGNTVFVKIYDQITIPTATDTPKLVIGCGRGNTSEIALPYGLDFTTGLGIRASLTPSGTSTATITPNTLAVNLFYTQ